MTNEQILKKAIEKAVAGGWNYFYFQTTKANPNVSFLIDQWIKKHSHHYFHIIFSHFFAKAFWGERTRCADCLLLPCSCSCEYSNFLEIYLIHLQRMVREPEPLKYLEKFLDETSNPRSD